jgi:16S rRNA (adenine1518-N6/adenine1519-N6)-dimethyltransferase
MGFQSKVIESKRSLGQNFFVNKNLAKQIADIVIEQKPDILIEIGPGTGYFTQFFIQHPLQLIAVEKDNVLAEKLQGKYPSTEVKNTDFLEWDLNELDQYREKKILFFGSLPYNVSKRIVKKIVESKYFNMDSFFIIQKEVAQKYTSVQPDNCLLSVYTGLYSDSKRLFDISPKSFKPSPKVNSSFVRFSPKEVDANLDRKAFEKFLKVCFKQPRKTLHNNLKNSFVFKNQKAKELLSQRPQHLSLNEFLFLFSNIR